MSDNNSSAEIEDALVLAGAMTLFAGVAATTFSVVQMMLSSSNNFGQGIRDAARQSNQIASQDLATMAQTINSILATPKQSVQPPSPSPPGPSPSPSPCCPPYIIDGGGRPVVT